MKHSIFFKITILFLFAMVSFFAFSFYFLKFQGERYSNVNEEQRYEKISMIFNKIISHDNLSLEAIQNYFREMGFIQIDNIDIKRKVMQEGAIFLRLNDRIVFKPVEVNNVFYILVAYGDEIFLYQDSLKAFYANYYFMILIGALILVVLFILVIRSLLPLIDLRRQVRKFASGNLQINCKVQNKDEIGDLANEFNKAIKHINALHQSRTLFLRSIMHELKTPITKGRITAEMVENKIQKERLTSVFYRLNTLIDEFAKIEQISSHNHNITKREFLVSDIVDYVKKMLLIHSLEQDPIINNAPNDLIKADFELFSMALKNLIDNAIKYSSDGKVIIDSDGKNLIISNLGDSLKKDINEYFQPYFKDSTKPNSQGFGLGMYIIKNTLDAQGFNIIYTHKAGLNYFTIQDCIVESSCLLPSLDRTEE